MDSSTRTQTSTTVLKQFDCPNCGNSLSLQHPRAREIACQYCGSVLDAASEAHQILTKLGEPQRHPPFSFIKLGQTGSLGNQRYKVISRTRWRMNYKEFWQEDGQSGYSNEIWVYDEWLLLSEYYTYYYLIEDRTGFWISAEIVPEIPILRPSNLRMRFFEGQRNRRVQEYGMAEVIFFEGESNYHIKTGDQIQFTMFKDRGISYSAEWRMDEDGQNIKEIEFFKETPISKRRLVEAFAGNEAIAEIKERQTYWRSIFRTARLAFIALVVLMLYSFLREGNLIYQETFELTLTENQSLTSSPIEVPDGGLYRLRMNASGMPTNSEVYLFAYVLNEDSAAINKIDDEFFYYTGYDSEGQWTERSSKESKVFRLKEGGTYFLRIFTKQQFADMGDVTISLYRGVWISRYFVMGCILLFFVVIFAYVKKNTY